jgi:hypothetical protein
MSVLSEYKDSLIFEIQKEFWNERGKGARYRLTMIGADFIGNHLKDATDLNEIKNFLIKEGFCKSIDMTEDEFTVTLKVQGCEFLKVRNGFMDKGQQPLCCPITNVFMRAIEKTSGLGPELLPIEGDGDKCVVGLGKIGSSDVVK